MGMRVVVRQPGGPERLHIENFTPPPPGTGEVLLRQTAIGMNFLDIYHRTGLYPLPGGIPGVEAAGIVEAVGEGTGGLTPGDRVVYGGPPAGAYCDTRIVDAERLHLLPADLSDDTAAATFFKALTAHMLLTRVYPVTAGTRLLIHAAAGGLGIILTRWAKLLGAEVFATVGSEAKADLARAAGADHVIAGRDVDFATFVADLTGGKGVDFAIDGIGGSTLARTFAAVRKFGMVASVGQAAGPIPPVEVTALGPLRSLSLSRPSVMAYAAEPDTYRTAGRAVIEAMASGITATIGHAYPLADVAAAHTDLEAGRTTGSVLLRP
ncbi:alcohol dehydrogenase [Pleomorphomonas diazotrophica]|uniref:Alcohol dehydrogenase n=1 Tax=Pleomorphomonas diazotrophica TaxID=1166257 RepID=A0A1I4V9J1_9HYPH|nr:alcohol dehydrogenase [Pleomorphomonas diazotrophica]SFM97834.1 NADPH2:quinone reductase [Pleomorphomonas diazotrophica]